MTERNSEKKLVGVRLDNLDLSRPDEVIMEEWRVKIGQNGGAVWVFVHPFYPEGKDGLPPECRVNFRESVEGFYQAVGGGEPVVVFEEYLKDSLQKLELKLALAGGGWVLLVKTWESSPTPCEVATRGRREVVDRLVWEKLIEVFRKLAIKRIVIGGGLLGERESWLNGKLVGKELSGCAGVAARELGKGFEVVFSRFTYPLVICGPGGN